MAEFREFREFVEFEEFNEERADPPVIGPVRPKDDGWGPTIAPRRREVIPPSPLQAEVPVSADTEADDTASIEAPTTVAEVPEPTVLPDHSEEIRLMFAGVRDRQAARFLYVRDSRRR